MEWIYGITTVPERRTSLLPNTILSLSKAGFPSPRLFIDGATRDDLANYQATYPSLEMTNRFPKIRTAGNWALSLAELYIRNPLAERYAIFQDDFIIYRNCREYLEKTPYPEKGYLNLYTFASNMTLVPKRNGKLLDGFFLSNQFGRGAVALVFNNEAVVSLLSAPHLVKRFKDPARGYKAIDGGIVTAMGELGYKEYVHNPSLTQHTGLKSSMGNKPHRQSPAFRGESYDALRLLENKI